MSIGLESGTDIGMDKKSFSGNRKGNKNRN